jgi:hypothetical protein
MAAISLGQVNTLEVRRGASRVIRLTPERDGGVVIFDTVTVEVRNADQTVVQAGAADVDDSTGVATFTIDAATTTDVDLDVGATGWDVVWTCSLDGEDEDIVHREPMDVVLYEVQPQVTWGMLTARHPDLPSRTNGTNAQPQITEAWADILGRLRGKGKRPTLIVDSVALREPHLFLTLAMVWRGLATGGEGSPEWQHAERYDARFEAAWASMTFEVADASTWQRTSVREGGGGGVLDTGSARRTNYRLSGSGFV